MGGWRAWAFLRDTQVTETDNGNCDGLPSQAPCRCAMSPRPPHVCGMWSADKDFWKNRAAAPP